MVLLNLKALRDKLLAEARPNRARAVGILRQDIVREVLNQLKNRGLIKFYLQTEAFSWADLVEGIDFYIVVIKERYITIPISVTGPFWIRSHLTRHPDIPVVAVDLRNGLAKAKALAVKRILRIINAAR